jgi:hypothetical protein
MPSASSCAGREMRTVISCKECNRYKSGHETPIRAYRESIIACTKEKRDLWGIDWIPKTPPTLNSIHHDVVS